MLKKFFRKLFKGSIAKRSDVTIKFFVTIQEKLIKLATEAEIEAQEKKHKIDKLEIEKSGLEEVARKNKQFAENFSKMFESK